MSAAEISVVVTDLDNTLWDWFGVWYGSFKPFLDELVRVTGIPEPELRAEIKVVHERHHTSEYSHVLQELPCLTARYGEKFNPVEKLPSVIETFREGRKSTSKSYPGALEALKEIRSAGSLVVGFTESQFYYTSQRIRTLGFDGILDILYSTEDTGSEEVQKMRTKPDSFYALQQTKVRIVPTHAKKPDAALLTSILNDLNVPPTSAIYVGDDLRKDILMANEAHVTSVHAKYGQAHKDSRYELLQAVTHWPRRDVDAQQDDEAGGKPDYVLQASFPEILSLFKFVAYLPK